MTVGVIRERWSAYELDRLCQLFPLHSGAQIAAEIGRSRQAVNAKALALQLVKSPKYKDKSYWRNRHRSHPKRDAFFAAIAPLLSMPMGASLGDILRAVDVKKKSAQTNLAMAVVDGRIFTSGRAKSTRYLATRRAAKAAAALIEAHRDARKQESKRAKHERDSKAAQARMAEKRALRISEKKVPSKGNKPGPSIKHVLKKRDPATEITLRPSKPKAPTQAQIWAQSNPIIPPTVKVQRLPGYTGAPVWELRGKTWKVAP